MDIYALYESRNRIARKRGHRLMGGVFDDTTAYGRCRCGVEIVVGRSRRGQLDVLEDSATTTACSKATASAVAA